MGAGFNRDCFVNDVAFDAGCRCQANLQATHSANDAAIDDNVVSHAFAIDSCAFADGQQVGADVAVNCAFDLDVASCLQVACDMQVCGHL